jgi:hypothetical protein
MLSIIFKYLGIKNSCKEKGEKKKEKIDKRICDIERYNCANKKGK